MVRQLEFPCRGSVYLVQLDPAIGREIQKTRPAVVISNNHMNELSATVLIMPITAGHYPYFHWINLNPPEGGVRKPSAIVTEQMRAVDKRRFRKWLGTIHVGTLRLIEAAIRDHCDLTDGGVLP